MTQGSTAMLLLIGGLLVTGASLSVLTGGGALGPAVLGVVSGSLMLVTALREYRKGRRAVHSGQGSDGPQP